MADDTATAAGRDLAAIRADAPLVHNITNLVVTNFTANVLLALGASPVMAHAIEEVEEMVGLARALVLNIGTLDAPWVAAMLAAGRAARARKIPVVLDPVGSGATRYRTETARRILDEVGPTIVRGNASEIASLAGAAGATKGVDSTRDAEATADLAAGVAAKWRCTVVVSGAVDLVVGDGPVRRVRNGHPLMTRVTGVGCAATAVIGAFAAVDPSPVAAAAHAMAAVGIAGELAAVGDPGPGTFAVRFLDALRALDAAALRSRLRVDPA